MVCESISVNVGHVSVLHQPELRFDESFPLLSDVIELSSQRHTIEFLICVD